MYPKVSSTQKKNPAPKDENVREEAQLEEDLKSVQPIGNEAANVELMDQMLKDANNDNNILDLSDEIPNYQMSGGIGSGRNSSFIAPGADDPNNSMYLNTSRNFVNENSFIRNKNKKGRYLDSSTNIVNDNSFIRNDNNIIRNDTISDISVGDELNIINTKSDEPKKKRKPSKDDEKKALNLAEKIVQGQAPKNDDFAPFPPTLLTRIWSLKPEATRAQKRRKKTKRRPDSKISSTPSPNQR